MAQLCPELKYGKQWVFVKDSQAPDEPPKAAPLATQREQRLCGGKRPANYEEASSCEEEEDGCDTPVAAQPQKRSVRGKGAQVSTLSVEAQPNPQEEVQKEGDDAVIENIGTPPAKNQEESKTSTNEASSPGMGLVSSVTRLVTRLMSADKAKKA